jgi:hypothetical protein
VLEALLLIAAASVQGPLAKAAALPSAELLEFLADWPDEAPIPPRSPKLSGPAPEAGATPDERRSDHE